MRRLKIRFCNNAKWARPSQWAKFFDAGKNLYDIHCMACHGKEA